MVFSSLTFLFLFLPFVVATYYLMPTRPLKNTLLLIASLVFYAWGEPIYVLLMVVSTINDYGFTLLWHRLKTRNRMGWARLFFMLSIAVNLGLLGWFKYHDFAMANLNALFGWNLPIRALPLPIGISFYTFQTMSYSIDAWRGKVKVQRNLLNMATFVTLFPQLIAGPIVRYAQIEDELGGRTHSFDLVSNGLRRFIKGLAKKVLLANQAGLIADAVFNQPAHASGTLLVWLGALAYTLQIYYDFSGYSDMAIGLGRIFGFHFPENFLHPYAARSITDFWRRWHVSLSTWFRDYVYIPLGGNRVKVGRQVFNLLLVWLLTGLWHGASWNYVLWGLYYGLLLTGEKFLWPKLLARLEGRAWTRGLLRVGTLLLVVIGWVLFRVENLPEMAAFVTRLFVFEPTTLRSLLAAHQDVLQALPWLIPGIALSFGRPNMLTNGIPDKRWPWAADLLRFALLGLCLVYLVGETYNPFIYFRF